MTDKKKILESQKELLQIRANIIKQMQQDVIDKQGQVQKARNAFTELVDWMKTELGIPKKDVKKWGFDKIQSHFIKKDK